MILITGHKGFIGSKLIERAFIASPSNLIDLKDSKDLMKCRLPKNVDLIIHLAAQTSVEESWEDPFTDSFNFNMTVRLSQAYPDARIIFTQSAAALEASSPYGFSKFISGEYLKKFHKDYVICTFPNVYGGGKGVADIFKSSDVVTVYGDGKQVRDFVHVEDIVNGLLLARFWPTGEYSMGSGKGTSILELTMGKTITHAPARKEIRESILPNTTPNWKPQYDVMGWMAINK